MQALSCFLHHHRDVVSPCEPVRDEGSQEFKVVNPLNRFLFDVQREWVSPMLPEVYDELFSFCCVESEIVIYHYVTSPWTSAL